MPHTQDVKVCPVAELEHDQPRCYREAGRDIFLVRHWDQLYALDNRCGHAGASLHLGDYTDGLIVCPLHGAAFDVKTGAVEWDAILPPPMADYRSSDNPRLRFFGELMEAVETLPIRRYPVRVDEADAYVYVALPAEQNTP